jgi:hypothetical protein
LLNAGPGAAFTLKTTNVSTGATGIFGWSSSTGANATRGVYGADGERHAVRLVSSISHGAGAAVHAVGNANDGVRRHPRSPSGGPGHVRRRGANSGDGVYGWSAPRSPSMATRPMASASAVAR